jgi:hypothetical protein
MEYGGGVVAFSVRFHYKFTLLPIRKKLLLENLWETHWTGKGWILQLYVLKLYKLVISSNTWTTGEEDATWKGIIIFSIQLWIQDMKKGWEKHLRLCDFNKVLWYMAFIFLQYQASFPTPEVSRKEKKDSLPSWYISHE